MYGARYSLVMGIGAVVLSFLIGVTLGAVLNLMLGMRVRHYAVSIMFAVSGALASFRHILINACPYWARSSPRCSSSMISRPMCQYAFSITTLTALIA